VEGCHNARLTSCYETNATLTQDVLTSTVSQYDWMGHSFPVIFDNSLQIAFNANNMDFIDHSACQVSEATEPIPSHTRSTSPPPL
jgi:hypothetical protein